MKITNLLICLSIFSLNLQQAQAQNANVTAGGIATGSGGKVSYSIGQVFDATQSGTGGSASQGVQQPFEILTLGKDNFPEIILSISVYPNPTTSILNLKINNSNFDNLQFKLTDVGGKEIQSSKITDIETQIQMENFPKAIYLLQVSDNKKPLKTFKIIKN